MTSMKIHGTSPWKSQVCRVKDRGLTVFSDSSHDETTSHAWLGDLFVPWRWSTEGSDVTIIHPENGWESITIDNYNIYIYNMIIIIDYNSIVIPVATLIVLLLFIGYIYMIIYWSLLSIITISIIIYHYYLSLLSIYPLLFDTGWNVIIYLSLSFWMIMDSIGWYLMITPEMRLLI